MRTQTEPKKFLLRPGQLKKYGPVKCAFVSLSNSFKTRHFEDDEKIVRSRSNKMASKI